MNHLTHRDASPLVVGRRMRPSRVNHGSASPSRRGGFTLVEMMVATALILMMMSMFATIFLISTGSMTRQRSLTESDQRNRMLATLLRSDLQRRTYRAVSSDVTTNVGLVPWHPSVVNLGAPQQSALGVAQKGYLELVENDPNDDTDDILQLTIQINTASNEDRYYGRADELANGAATGGFAQNPNQPEADDGQITTNRTAQSQAAEVVWFLRNGNLYRRVMLLREPLSWTPSFSATPHYGSNGDTAPFVPGTPAVFVASSLGTSVTVQTNSFYNHFDMSAHYDHQSAMGAPNGLVWHSLSWLGNDPGTGHVTNGAYLLGTEEGTSLGLPNWRFGHCPRRGSAIAGFPRPGEGVEFVGAPGNLKYIGRFTHEETSADDFRYPGNAQTGADAVWGTNDDKNPLTRRSSQLTLNGIGVVSQLPGGSRRGEDLVMSGVLAFDIKVWDDHMGAFVDLGHQLQNAGVNGDYHSARVLNTNYSPTTPPRFRFDTWHPEVKLDPSSTVFEVAPFRPATVGVDGVAGSAGDDDGDGADDNIQELGSYGSDDVLKPLRAVQIRVRFKVPGTDDVREITIVHSFREAS